MDENKNTIEDIFFKADKSVFNERPYENGFLSKTMNENTPGKTGGMCVVFGAPTGTGKSTFTAMEVNKSLERGKKVIVWTTEADPEDYYKTIAKCRGAQPEQYDDLLEELSQSLRILDSNILITENISVLCSYMASNGFTELYIDYLDTSMINADNAAEKSSHISLMVRHCKDQAKAHNLFIWINAQAKCTDDKELTVNSFRDSTALCNAATSAFILTKVREADDFVSNSNYVIHFIKSRYSRKYAGPGTKVYININQDTFSVQELAVMSDGQTIKQYEYKNFI